MIFLKEKEKRCIYMFIHIFYLFKKCSKNNVLYKNIMIEFMVEHPVLAKVHINSPKAKSKSRRLWEGLTPTPF